MARREPSDRPDLTGRIVTARAGIGATALLEHPRRLRVDNIWLGRPTIVMVASGRKRVRVGRDRGEVGRGGIVALPSGTLIGLDNDPEGSGVYRATSIILDETLLAAVPPDGAARPVSTFAAITRPPGGFARALGEAREALLDPAGAPDAVAGHKMAELLLWLRASGWCFQQRPAFSAADRLRALVHADLEEDWSGARVAAALGMSRATLHRRLAVDGTTVARLVQESRLLAAMQLLQATDQTVTSVGFACGFATPSSFARQFRQRFDLAPSEVRADEVAIAPRGREPRLRPVEQLLTSREQRRHGSRLKRGS